MPTDDEMRPPPLSRAAFTVMALLVRRSGTMRIGPLLAACGLGSDALADAVNELVERHWVRIVWRDPDARLPEALPARLQPVRRVVTTRFGRWRFPRTWPELGE